MNRKKALNTNFARLFIYKQLKKCGLCWLFMLLLLTANQTYALPTTDPAQVIEDYLHYIQLSTVKLSSKEASAKESLQLRADLVNGKKFWWLQKGKPGRAFNVIQFFHRRSPSNWNIQAPIIESSTVNIDVNFDVPVFVGSPWRTNFQLVQIDKQWKIKSFTDLTKRPIQPAASINQVLDSYFTTARGAVQRLYSEKLDKNEKQRITSELSFGAGFWTGQTKNKDFPAGTMFIFFSTQRPINWQIEKARIAGAYGEAVVNFSIKRRDGTSKNKRYTFELTQLDKDWFITGHRSKKNTKKEVIEQVGAISAKATPNDIVQLQIALLAKQSSNLQNLAKASEPLWVDARNARRGMSRIIAVTKGFSAGSQTLFSWKVAQTKITADEAIVIIDAVWSKPPVIKMFTGMKLSLQKTVSGWRISNSELLRN